MRSSGSIGSSPEPMVPRSVIARLTAALILSSGLLAGCASPGYYDSYGQPVSAYPVRIEYGTVENIELFRTGNAGPIGIGAILGGVAGGVIGHQIGSGRGNTAATIAGAIGGAIVGNEVEKSREAERYRITVRLDAGATLAVTEVGQGELRVGDRVRVIDNRVYRE